MGNLRIQCFCNEGEEIKNLRWIESFLSFFGSVIKQEQCMLFQDNMHLLPLTFFWGDWNIVSSDFDRQKGGNYIFKSIMWDELYGAIFPFFF